MVIFTSKILSANLIRDYGKACDGWVFSQFYSNCDKYLFQLSNLGTLVQVEVSENKNQSKIAYSKT